MTRRFTSRKTCSRAGTGVFRGLAVAVIALVLMAASTAFALPFSPTALAPEAGQELVSRRTATAKHFYLGDGRYMARISSQAVHYLDTQGHWQESDTEIATVENGAYRYAAERNGLRAYFKQSSNASAAVRVEMSPRSPEEARAGPESLGWLTWQPTRLLYVADDGYSRVVSNSKPAGAKVRGSVLTYSGSFPGTIDHYTVRNNLLKHDVVVSVLPALSSHDGQQPAFLSYEGLIEFPEGYSLYADGAEQTGSFTTPGSIELRDDAGHPALWLRAPYAYEDANPGTSVRARYIVEVSGSSARLAVQVPYDWLADPSRVYPVVIDPTVSIDTTRDTDIDEDAPDTNNGGGSTLTVCNKDELVCNERALLYFDLSSIPAGYDTEATIEDADMYLWVDYLWALGDDWYIEVDTHALTTDWTEYGATWNSPWTTPGGDYDGYTTTTTIWGDEEDEWKSWIMTYIVRWWYSGELPNYGVILRSDHQYGGTKYARFNSRDAGSHTPYLDVTYTLTPYILSSYAEQVHGTPDPSQHFQFTYTNNYWQAAGINPPAGTDYDLRLYSDSGYSSEEAYSDGENDVVDFVLVNGNTVGAPDTYYPLAEAYSGSGDYPIEWAEGGFPELSNGSLGPFTMGSDDVVRVWDADLSIGSTYYFSVFPTSGDADLGIALFSPSNGNYQDRFDAVAGADTYYSGQPEFFEYTATTSGYHGLVVWNEGATSDTSFKVYRDTSAPSCSMAINNGDAYTTNSSATLNLSASDLDTGVWQMRFQDAGGSWTSWTNYASTYAWTLPGSDGQKTVNAEFKNYAGAVCDCSDSITLDRGDPQSQASIFEEYWTTSISPVPVDWTASDTWSGVASVRLYARKEGGSWADSGLSPQSGTSGTFNYWPSSGEGRYYFQTSATDGAGNQEDPPSGSSGSGDDSVFYDASKPSSGLVYCPGYANSTFSVEYNASDGSGSGLQTLQLHYKKESGGTWNYYGTCSAVPSGWCDFTPPSGEGTYYLATKAQDFAGLWEDSPSGSGDCNTFYETQNPDSTITRPSGPGWYNLTVVYRMEGTASDTGGSGLYEIELAIKRDSDNYYWHGCGGGWQSGSETWFPANGTTSWYYEPACTPWEDTESYTLRSRAKDNAGNLQSSPAQVQFSYDNVKPYSSVGVPGDGDNRNSLTDVSGTANDNGGSSLYKVHTSIKRNSDNYYWNSSAWASGSEVWLEAWRAGSTWVYDTDYVTWQSDHTYTIRSKAQDNAGNEETPGSGHTFLFDDEDPSSTASPPTSQIGGDIAIPYTAGDTGGSGLDHVRLWKNYESGGWTLTSGYETGSSGTFYFIPTDGDGSYCFQSIAHDEAYNVEDGPTGSGDGCTSYSGTPPNHDPTLDWTGEPNYISDGLHPGSGGTGDSYVYRIEYTDVDGDPPNYVRVHIEKGGADISGSPFTLAYVSGSHTTGAFYSYTKTGLPEGTDYTYYFEAQDDQGHDAAPTTELDAPDVSPPNNPPSLAWTGETNYTSDGLHPESGGTADSYVYRIEYTDADGDPPSFVRVHVEKGGSDVSGSPFTLAYVSGSYTTGAIYSYTKVGLAAGTDYTYYFEAQDDLGSPATPTSELDAPDVTGTNDPPLLSWTGETNYVSDGLHPESGTTSDDYEYRIEYSDADGDAPNYVRVHIEKGGTDVSGSPFTLACGSGDYTTGVICSYTKSGLAEGSDYTYYFEAEDDLGHPATPTTELDAPDVSDSGLPKWTFLVYLNGDAPSPTEDAAIDDFLEMSSIGSTSEVNVVVWFDPLGDVYTWDQTHKFYVTKGMTPDPANGVYLGEKDMSDPQTLIDFVQTEKANYPAEHYALIIWDRGSELRRDPPENTLLGDICFDNNPIYSTSAMTMPELRTALSTITDGGADPLDLLGFDASLMALAEIDNQLKPYADVRVSSQGAEPSGGWNYDEVLNLLTLIPEMTPAEFAEVIVDWYCPNYGNEPTMSATDLQTPCSDLDTAVDNLVVALMAGAATHHADIATARANTQVFSDTHYVDLYDFADQLNSYVSDAAINTAATAVMDAVDGAVINECGSLIWPDAHGISIYFPESEEDYDDNYDGYQGWLQYTADHHWDEWLHAFYTMGSIAPFPFYDGFESGTLGLGWSTFVTGTGRARVSSPTFRYEGSYTLSLDNEFEHANDSIAAAILTIDLSGQSEVYLDFWWRDWYDETQPQDGVFISDDWGLNWHQVYPFDLDPVSWYAHPIIDLAAEAASHGLTLNDHFQIKFQAYASVPISSYGDSDGYTIDAVWVDSSPHGVATLPFYDGFESGMQLHDVWQEYQPNRGNVSVGSEETCYFCRPYAGEYCLALEGPYNYSPDATAAAILTLDLSEEAGALLDFWWREWNDENHPEDGVFISDDQGANWYQALSFNDGPSSYRHDIVDLAEEARSHGLAFNNIFQIKFQFYGNWDMPTDGYLLDEVRIRNAGSLLPLVAKRYQ